MPADVDDLADFRRWVSQHYRAGYVTAHASAHPICMRCDADLEYDELRTHALVVHGDDVTDLP